MRLWVDSLSHLFPQGGEVLKDLNFSVSKGQFLSILGPSGCGKSTFLRIVAGLLPPTSGRVHGTGDCGVSFVFQEAHLLPWRTVLANAALPLELAGVPEAERHSRARRVLGELGLSDALKRFPHELSGGMKMRVSIARALITEPKLLLLDEPFSSLDEIIRLKLGELVRTLWQSRKMTVVLVTHSISEAVFLSDRILVMKAGPGEIVADQKVELPATRTRELRGSVELAMLTQKFSAILEQVSGVEA